MDVSTANGGTMELVNGRNVWINFLVMSNELTTPKLLYCPADVNGFSATNSWVGFPNLSKRPINLELPHGSK